MVRFQYGCKNNLSNNQLTVVIVEKIPVEEEPEVSTIPDILEEQVELEKGYYRCVVIMLRFLNQVGVETNLQQTYMQDYHDEEEMDDVNLDDERERHWRIVFENNGGGVNDAKALVHAKRWDIYVN